jgi:hypothetical protein
LKLIGLRDEWAAKGIVRNQVNHRMERVRRMFKWGVSRQLVFASFAKTGAGLDYCE